MTKPLRPVLFKWDDDVMIPEPRLLALCRRQFVVDQTYPLEVVQPRNMASHRGYFASLHEAWLNLAEEHTERFKTSEHLRAWALVTTGWCKETDYPCDSIEEAMFVAKIIRARSAYAIIGRKGNVVKVFDPRSQAVYGPDAMSAEDFKVSKQQVLDLVATMARTTRGELNRNAGRSA
jgi:hypothetical protein